jgi:hypothetical protein
MGIAWGAESPAIMASIWLGRGLWKHLHGVFRDRGKWNTILPPYEVCVVNRDVHVVFPLLYAAGCVLDSLFRLDTSSPDSCCL